jgi:HAMP domain-containing protein
MKKLGIKGKITLGFMVLLLLLAVSGIISIYELMRMRTSVSGIITSNVSSLAASQELLNMVQRVSYATQEFTFNGNGTAIAELASSDSLTAKLLEHPDGLELYVQGNPEALAGVENLFYPLHAAVRDMLLLGDSAKRQEAYFRTFAPAHRLLVQNLGSIVALNQRELNKNAAAIEQNRYRTVMPCIIAVFAGVALTVMFNYFIMHYFANPLIRITRAVENTVEYKSPFRVSVEPGDEMGELHSAITALVAQVKKAGKAEVA